MLRLKPGISDRNRSYLSLKQTQKLIPIAALVGAALSASATPSLSRVSCGSNAYQAAGTDACSVYLTSKTNGRISVSLTSNNPAVIVPASVTVRSGAKTTGFQASVSAVEMAQTATITATAGGGSVTFNISLTPANTGTPELSINATSIGFGNVEVNTAAEQSLTLTSTGTASATVTAADLSGIGFSILGAAFPVTLSPGQAMTVNVGFDPASAGRFSGQLSFASNASTPIVTLSGAGTAPCVDLSWLAPNSPNDAIVGYNVYRAPGGTTSFQRMNGSPSTQTAYTDTTIQSGQTYLYYVTSLDSSGAESAPSSTTSTIIP